MDESECIFTCCLFNPFLVRYLIRSAYNIPGTPLQDCCYTTFCTPCAVNQMYQTTKALGLANPNAGKKFNVGRFGEKGVDSGSCGKFCYAACCLPCAVGYSIEKSVGLPCVYGCLFGSVCWARNITRYQFRIRGSDCFEDCCCIGLTLYLPMLCMVGGVFCFPCASAGYIYVAGEIGKILSEADVRNHTAGRNDAVHYLSDHAAGGVPPMAAAGYGASGAPMPYPPFGTATVVPMNAPVATVPVQQFTPQPAYATAPPMQYTPVPGGVGYAMNNPNVPMAMEAQAAPQAVIPTAQMIDYSSIDKNEINYDQN